VRPDPIVAYFGDPERIVAAVVGVGALVLLVGAQQWVTRGIDRWLWWHWR